MKYYSYKVPRDFGFAPNPFGKYCTLATCKPDIRKNAVIGDWIIGIGAVGNDTEGLIIYAMRVSEKLTFEEYWEDERFQDKKPRMNGSLKAIKGDNIYHKEGEKWLQLDSHHSNPDGSVNETNLNTDLKGKYVLISDLFYYLGDSRVKIPEEVYEDVYHPGIGYKLIKNEKSAKKLLNFLARNFSKGITGLPISFTSPDRYKGSKK